MYSDICIQDINSVKCGKFCIGFIKYVNSKKSYNDFISKFDFVKLYKNDEIVENIYLWEILFLINLKSWKINVRRWVLLLNNEEIN